MSIYDFSPEDLEAMRAADAAIEAKPRRVVKKSAGHGGDRRSKGHINHVGNPLWEYRVMEGLTQKDLAEKMFICQQSISDMERGRLPLNEYVVEWLVEYGGDEIMERCRKELKYKNIPDSRNGIKFSSKKEAARYDELMLMLKAGTIRKLKLQPEFTLQEAFTTPEGERVLAIKYRADFSYELFQDQDWIPIVEDVKSAGTRTHEYLIKRKMCMDKGIAIREV